MSSNKKDYIGKRYGRLVVLSEVETANPKEARRFLCKCDCGNVDTYSIKYITGVWGWLKEQKEKMCEECRMGCPYPANKCEKNLGGMCCRKCDEYDICADACLNTPDKCRH